MTRDDSIEQIRQRLSLVDLVQKHVPLRKSGRHFVGLCPFHSEKTPSFHVNPDKQLYYCFGCGVGGDLFRFYMQTEHVGFQDALKELAKRAGVTLPQRPSEARRESLHEAMRGVLEAARSFFRAQLASAAGKSAFDYLRARGLTPETIERFELGWAPEGWENLRDHFRSRKVDLSLAETCGLLRSGRSGYFDLFRARVIFPIRDGQGRLAGFGGRVTQASTAAAPPEGRTEPKYFNSPETELFHKGDLLYGLHHAREHILKASQATLVEGYMDVIALHQAGLPTAVAPLGTALTENHVRGLKRVAATVKVLFDADDAGTRAALRALPLLLAEGVLARAVRLPRGEDPDSLIRRLGPSEMHRRFEADADLFDVALDTLIGGSTPATPQKQKQAADAILTILRAASEPVVQDAYLKKAAAGLGIREQSLWRSLTTGRVEPPLHAPPAAARPDPRDLRSLRARHRTEYEEDALQAAFDDPLLWEVVVQTRSLFSDPWHLKLIKVVSEQAGAAEERTPDALMAHHGDDLDPARLTRLQFRSGPAPDALPEARLRDALENLHDLAKKDKLVYVRNLIRKASRSGSSAEMKDLYRRKKEVETSRLPWPIAEGLPEWLRSEPENTINHERS
ncbi:MAG: DNA primase [Nitrospirae bacterium]|nr:DNA primase [Nitrospirota bacterium]